MKYKLFIVGVGFWIVLLVLSVVFLRIWLYLILALPVAVLIFWDMLYKEAWNEGYESYGQPKWTLRDDLKRRPRFAKVLIVLNVVFYYVICWPLLLIYGFGYFRGKRVAQKEDKHEQKCSGQNMLRDYIKVPHDYLTDPTPNAYGYDGTDEPIEKVDCITEDVFNDFVKSQQKGNVQKSRAQKHCLKSSLTNKLTRPERLIIVLYYYEKMTIKQIAEELELSEARVSQMHSSIIARLKAQMKKINPKDGSAEENDSKPKTD